MKLGELLDLPFEATLDRRILWSGGTSIRVGDDGAIDIEGFSQGDQRDMGQNGFTVEYLRALIEDQGCRVGLVMILE